MAPGNIKTLLVTGGCGFIGSNFIRYLLREYADLRVINLDLLTYAGNMENFTEEELKDLRHRFVRGDVRKADDVEPLVKEADAIVHLAAETHIDRSLARADDFITTDMLGTYVLLEAVRKAPCERVLIVSTSEVYGTAQSVPMTESHPLNPQSPYAGAKAGADRLAFAYYGAYELPVVIIRPFNNYGPFQYPEKLIPLFTINGMTDLPLPLYGTGENTRDWLYVEDHCEALALALQKPIETLAGYAINLGTGRDYSAREIAQRILDILGKPHSLIQSVEDRPGHVARLIASNERARTLLSWSPITSLDRGLEKTVIWYQNNKRWWEPLFQKRSHWDPRRDLAGYAFVAS
jgi:dTDP-glucose 4,6-dehydratase